MNRELSIKLRESVAEPTTEERVAAQPTSALLGGARRMMRAIADVASKPRGDVLALRPRRIRREEVLSRQQFLQQLAREKRRADRTKMPLSIAIFEFAASDGDDFPQLIALACENKRETDFLGYLDDARVAVLLPDTSEQGMRRFIEKVVTDSACACSTIVETYPNRLFDCLKGDPETPHSIGPLAVESAPGPGRRRYVAKCAIDFAGAAVGLVVLAPLFLVVALAIAIDSPGPVMYRQTRLGRGGKPFVFYKFRSMYRDADERVHREYVTSLIAKDGSSGASQKPWSKLSADPRITRVGRFLRKTCLDELPQLINVIKGDLSLVGPRPPLPYEAVAYESWHLRRVLEVKPGITGLWQVEGQNLATFNDMVRMDLRYVRTWLVMLDLRILVKTALLVLARRGGG